MSWGRKERFLDGVRLKQVLEEMKDYVVGKVYQERKKKIFEVEEFKE